MFEPKATASHLEFYAKRSFGDRYLIRDNFEHCSELSGNRSKAVIHYDNDQIDQKRAPSRSPFYSTRLSSAAGPIVVRRIGAWPKSRA